MAPTMVVMGAVLAAQQGLAIQDAIVLVLLHRIHKPTVTVHTITMDPRVTITIVGILINNPSF